jgi:hypothetical protein
MFIDPWKDGIKNIKFDEIVKAEQANCLYLAVKKKYFIS